MCVLLRIDTEVLFKETEDDLSITEMGKKVGDFTHVLEITL